MFNMEKTIHTIDASGRMLARVASEAAHVLMGKHKVDFRKNVVSPTFVQILNIEKLVLSESKQKGKEYRHYTGYPSGLRKKTMTEIVSKKGREEVIRRAVYGMLPGNKLRSLRMKNLILRV